MQTEAHDFEAACRKASWPPQSNIRYQRSEAFTNATARWNAYVANAANIPFLATGGRHGYGVTLERLQNGLAIDLSRLNGATINRNNSTIAVGGGAKFREVLKPVAEAASGSCNGARYIGSGFGAGIGYLQGTLGLVIDSLVSAIRGAGTNFGIITSAVFKLSQPVNEGEVFYVDLIYGASQK
ncbi:hypothetical protein F5Y09DRAFT_343486 [Xylaria sp. FL1042]|nr:hypothetical protein F5Y09DRAFT_343486 [Xylaria sp. FL1042]